MDYTFVLVFLGLVSCSLGSPSLYGKSYINAVQDPVDTIITRIEEPGFFSPLIGNYKETVQKEADMPEEIVQQQEADIAEEILQQKEDDKYKEVKETVNEIQEKNSKILDLMQEISQSCSKTETRQDVVKLLEKINQFEAYAKSNIDSIKDICTELETRLSLEPDDNLITVKQFLNASAFDLEIIYKLIINDYINTTNLDINTEDFSDIKQNINEVKKYIDKELNLVEKGGSFFNLTKYAVDILN